jgi:hypothetical protein
MNRFSADLKFDIPLLKPEVDISQFYGILHYAVDIEQCVNKEFIEFFESIHPDLGIGFVESFYLPPFDKSAIHIDQLDATQTILSDFTKINWVYHGEDALMNWYMPLNSNSGFQKIGAITSATGESNRYRFYNESEVEKVHSQRVNFPSLVQTGIPHDVRTSTHHRLCFSMSFGFKSQYRRLNWQESTDILKDYLL